MLLFFVTISIFFMAPVIILSLMFQLHVLLSFLPITGEYLIKCEFQQVRVGLVKRYVYSMYDQSVCPNYGRSTCVFKLKTTLYGKVRYEI